jgi:putative transposase
MSDHIHLFVKGNQNITISNIVKYLKGYSSYELRKKFIFLKKYKSLWTPSYFCETIGHISEDVVKKYIENQNNH